MVVHPPAPDPEGNAFLWRRSGDSQDPSPLGDVGKSRSVLLPRSRCSISVHACRVERGVRGAEREEGFSRFKSRNYRIKLRFPRKSFYKSCSVESYTVDSSEHGKRKLELKKKQQRDLRYRTNRFDFRWALMRERGSFYIGFSFFFPTPRGSPASRRRYRWRTRDVSF